MSTVVCNKKTFDLIVLDWMLPGMNGIELTRWSRRFQKSVLTPILFVTAKTEPEMVAMALDNGADDYITKPFDTLVFMARVNALLRRQEWLREHETNDGGQQMAIGPLILNADLCEVLLNREKIELTRSEFRLLQILMLNQGKVLSRGSKISH